MKVQNNQSSVPSGADFFIKYEGTLDTTDDGLYTQGNYAEFVIQTEIINSLVALFICVATGGRPNDPDNNINTGVQKVFSLPYMLAKNGKFANVIVRVPYGCVCNYMISGQKTLKKYLALDKEVVETPMGFATGFTHLGHEHDGRDSNKVLATALAIPPGNANKALFVDGTGSFIVFKDPDGVLGAFNLELPEQFGVVDMTQPTVTFQWTASSGATSYKLRVFDSITFTNLIISVDGIVGLNSVQNTSLLQPNTYYYWYIIATDGSETLTSQVFTFFTNENAL